MKASPLARRSCMHCITLPPAAIAQQANGHLGLLCTNCFALQAEHGNSCLFDSTEVTILGILTSLNRLKLYNALGKQSHARTCLPLGADFPAPGAPRRDSNSFIIQVTSVCVSKNCTRAHGY